jgi:hypothetical protein
MSRVGGYAAATRFSLSTRGAMHMFMYTILRREGRQVPFTVRER